MTMTADSRRIVLVDDEEVLAWSLSNRLGRARPSWIVDTENTAEAALERLRKGQVDLLVADVRMPGMSGIDLILAARLEQPELSVVVMTAFQTADIQRIVGAPYTGFIEKPFEFERFLELVDESLAARPVGFSGAISVQTLPDIVQLYVLSSATGMLVVDHHSGEGRLWFDRGAILHAATVDARGDDAFYQIMMWSGGEFRMRIGAKAPERSIQSDWQELLMESCRRIDERRRRDEPHSTTKGWTQSQAPPPPESDVDAFFDQLTDESSPQGISSTTYPSPRHVQPPEVTMNIKDSLTKLNQIDGFVGAALVDSESGMLLGSEGGGGINLEVAAAGNTEVVRAKRKTMGNLALKDGIEDILITLGKQYHLIRPLRARSTIFFYLALDRQRSNLAMARIALADVEKELQV
ncbi:MAG: DUF4388 domain-containing protein [Labilithrix sp.]|nr:DUF4388 domain-containing protein [Labilithrix sp.]MBX3222835.1 DUF4388 domain-containing protein [Labilithrix sp.]